MRLILLLFLTGLLYAQVEAPSGHPVPRSNGQIHSSRNEELNEPCKFAPVYRRIQDNKSDPRVAFIELRKLVDPTHPSSFTDRCKYISDQVDDVWGIFDKPHGYLQFFSSAGDGPDYDEGLAYFAGDGNKAGVFLYATHMEDEEAHTFVFAYRDGAWRDLTKEYLGPLRIGAKDQVSVPRRGRTAEIWTYGTNGDGHIHKSWLRWTGERFEIVAAK